LGDVPDIAKEAVMLNLYTVETAMPLFCLLDWFISDGDRYNVVQLLEDSYVEIT